MRSHLLTVDFKSRIIAVWFRSLCLCQWVQGFPTLCLLSGSVYLVICIGLCFIWSWVLSREVSLALLAVFYMQASSLTCTNWERCYLFSFQYVFLPFLFLKNYFRNVGGITQKGEGRSLCALISYSMLTKPSKHKTK